MAIHKLILEEDPVLNFKLFAVHSIVEDYKMAFLINKWLSINLKRERKDFKTKINNTKVAFPLFEYKNSFTQENYCLIPNSIQTEILESQKTQNLFLNTQLKTQQNYFVIPEHNKVDYILKLDGISNAAKIKTILLKLKQIKQVNSIYQIKLHTIKSNTIFQL